MHLLRAIEHGLILKQSTVMIYMQNACTVILFLQFNSNNCNKLLAYYFKNTDPTKIDIMWGQNDPRLSLTMFQFGCPITVNLV